MFKLNFTPIHSKVSVYNTTGTGRDTYISHNSGGFVKAVNTERLLTIGSGRRPPSTAGQTTRIQGKPVYYHSNGTGRDSYICVNSGGLTGASSRGGESARFSSGLRSYDRTRTPSCHNERDHFEWAQTARLGVEAAKEIERAKTVKDVTSRLSRPKTSWSFASTSDSKLRLSSREMTPSRQEASAVFDYPRPESTENVRTPRSMKIKRVQKKAGRPAETLHNDYMLRPNEPNSAPVGVQGISVLRSKQTPKANSHVRFMTDY